MRNLKTIENDFGPGRTWIVILILIILVAGPSIGLGEENKVSFDAEKLTEAAYPTGVGEGVLFSYDDPGAGNVFLAGDFNDWSQSADPMKKNSSGIWWIVKKLPPGTTTYKFVVDGSWTADPNNPDIAGDYGNSVIVVGTGSKVLPPPPSSEKPMNTNIIFHGDFRGRLKSTLGTDEVTGIESSEQVVFLDVDGRLQDKPVLWARLNMLTGEGYAKAVLERMNLTLTNEEAGMNVFYNVFGSMEIDLEDPYGLTSHIGEYEDGYGRNSQGVFLHDLSIPGGIIGDFLYGTDISSDDDMEAARLRMDFTHFSLGASARREKTGNPDWGDMSAENRLNDLGGIDFTTMPFGTATMVVFEILHGRDRISDSVTGDWNTLDDHTVIYGEVKRLLAPGLRFGLLGSMENLRYRNSMIYWDTDERSDASMIDLNMTLEKWKTHNQPCEFSLKAGWRRLAADENMPWERLWDFRDMSTMGIDEYLITGYRDAFIAESSLSLTGSRGRFGYDVSWTGEYSVATIESGPWVMIHVMDATITRGRWALISSGRAAIYNSDYLDLNENFLSGYMAFELRISKSMSVRLSYGLRPEDDNDEIRAGTTFLHDHGLTGNSVRDNYMGLGQKITTAENSLSDYSGIILEGRFRF